jgi:hypothetical protein
MPLILLLLASTLVAPGAAAAQERWHQLPGAAGAFAVDLHSLARKDGVLLARIRTRDAGTLVSVEDVEVRCSAGQLRTIRQQGYDIDTGRPVSAAGQEGNQRGARWAEYTPGSEGHAVLSSLCALARDRKLLAPAEHSSA